MLSEISQKVKDKYQVVLIYEAKDIHRREWGGTQGGIVMGSLVEGWVEYVHIKRSKNVTSKLKGF